MACPNWLSSYLEDSDLDKIQKTVTLAESKTDGEIVPMVVRRSTPFGHLPLTVFLLLTVFFEMLSAAYVQSEWNFSSPWTWSMAGILLAWVVAFLTRQSPFLARHLTPHRDQIESVLRRAHLEFYATGIPATEHRTGVLIFVSLLERQVVVMGDEKISERIKSETWDSLVRDLVSHTRQGEFANGLCKAIANVGEILAREFPAVNHGANELPNELLIKE